MFKLIQKVISLLLLIVGTQSMSDTSLFHTMKLNDTVPKVLTEVRDIAITSNGEMYASTRSHIKKYDVSGNLVSEWQKLSANNYPDPMPALSLDSNDHLYATYDYQCQIVKYNIDGTIALSWDARAENDTTDCILVDMVIDSNDNVFVLRKEDVLKFKSDGTFLKKWGSAVNEDGLFDNAAGISTDTQNNIYIIDSYGGNIQKFDNNGTFLSKFNISGHDLIVDGNNHMFVLQQNDYKIEKYDQNGTKLSEFGNGGESKSSICSMSNLSLVKNDKLYISSSVCNWVQAFDLDGNFIQKWGSYGERDEVDRFSFPQDVTTDSEGNLYVADSSNYRIQKFDRFGHYVLSWGVQGNNDGEFQSPRRLIIDQSDNLYVSDGNGLQKFDRNGHFLFKLDFNTLPDGVTYASHIALDSHNIFYATDNDGHRIVKFDTSGYKLGEWGSYGNGEGEFESYSIAGITIDHSDRVYVSDSQNNRIQIFDSNGTFLSQWVFADDIFPFDLTLDESEGYAYFIDGGERVAKCSLSNGNIVEQWGNNNGFVDGENEFYTAEGITVDIYGNVYVAEMHNHRIQKKESGQTIPPIIPVSNTLPSIVSYLLF